MKNALFALIKKHRVITFVLIAFLSLGITYSLASPLFEASDELWHYPYVKYVADGHGLPVQDPRIEQPWKQEGGQPPLYYALSALATFWIDTDDMSELLWRNPHAQIGVPLAHGNKNMVIHTTKEAFPYRGTALAVHIIRLLSVFMGAITVLLTYLIALAIFPGRKTLAAGAAAINAFNPMYLFISGSVNNDNLAILLSSLALWLILRLSKGDVSWPLPVGLGVVIGLAALTKVSALCLLPLAMVAWGIVAFRQRSPLPFVRASLIVFLLTALIAGWWYARNWLLYGDPFGFNVWLAIAGARKIEPTWSELLAEFEGFRISFWALFGGVNVLADPFVYKFYDAISLLGMLGLAVWIAQGARFRVQGSKPLESGKWIVFLWPVILLAALIRWTRLTMASQGRLIFPAISAISLLLALGLLSLGPKRYARALLGLVVGIMLIIAAISPFRYIAPAYAKPALLSLDDVSEARPLHINYDGRMELIGFQIADPTVRPGQALQLTLYWRSLAKMGRDYSIFVHLFGRDDQPVGQVDTYPGGGTYPTSLWEVGDVVGDTYRVPIAADAVTPTAARIEVGLYTLPAYKNLPAFDPQGRSIGTSPAIARIKIAPLAAQERPEVQNSVRFELAGHVTLIGYDLDKTIVKPGETIHLTLYWQVLGKMDKDYTVFTHLIDGQDRLWGQQDGLPLGGDYPTSFWEAGEFLTDGYDIRVSGDASPGRYLLEVGMYDAGTGVRLPVVGEEGPVSGDRALIGEVWVRR